jgi:hypothetical protein
MVVVPAKIENIVDLFESEKGSSAQTKFTVWGSPMRLWTPA